MFYRRKLPLGGFFTITEQSFKISYEYEKATDNFSALSKAVVGKKLFWYWFNCFNFVSFSDLFPA